MDNKDKILNAALKLFITKGFHGTSTSKIAKEAGVSNGTLFYYFNTKEALISRLYLKLKEEHKEYLLEHMIPCETSKSKIKQFWLTCVQWELEHKDSVAFYEMFAHSPYIDKLSKKEASRNFQFVFDMFKKAIDEEILINVNPELIFYFFFGSVKSFVYFIKDNPDNFEEYQEMAFRMCWRSIANI